MDARVPWQRMSADPSWVSSGTAPPRWRWERCADLHHGESLLLFSYISAVSFISEKPRELYKAFSFHMSNQVTLSSLYFRVQFLCSTPGTCSSLPRSGSRWGWGPPRRHGRSGLQDFCIPLLGSCPRGSGVEGADLVFDGSRAQLCQTPCTVCSSSAWARRSVMFGDGNHAKTLQERIIHTHTHPLTAKKSSQTHSNPLL